MYRLHVEAAVDVQESGSFFKARPFVIQVGDRRFECIFRKGTTGKVVYALVEGDRLLVELSHPYYAPEFEPSESVRFGADEAVMVAVYAALGRVGVTKDKAWVAYLQEKPSAYTITQS
jgi:hypothetical protein